MSQNKVVDGQICLSRLIHAKYKSSKGADCLMIPIEANLLEKDEDGNVYIPLRVVLKPETDERGQDGFIAKKIGTEVWKSASKEQQEAWKDNSNEETKKVTPILGNIKDWSRSNGGQQSGAVGNGTYQAPADGQEDDLPF